MLAAARRTRPTCLNMISRPRSASPPPSAASFQLQGPPLKKLKTNAAAPGPNYGTGLHLAPMVRVGTLPTRLIALEHSAELVWGPEIVDKALIGSERIVHCSLFCCPRIKRCTDELF